MPALVPSLPFSASLKTCRSTPSLPASSARLRLRRSRAVRRLLPRRFKALSMAYGVALVSWLRGGMALHGSVKRLNGTSWYQINTRKIDQCQGVGTMSYRKLAFWRHKVPKQNIHGDHSPAWPLPPFSASQRQSACSPPRAPIGLLHMSGRIAEVTADPFGHNARRIQRDRKSLAETRWPTNMPRPPRWKCPTPP